MLDYAHLEALMAISREKSFERAAQALHLTPSAISQRIKKLEERIGAIVVSRTNPAVPTDIGKLLCLHAETVQILESKILSNPSDAINAGSSVETKIKIVINDASLCSWFIEALAQDSSTSGENLFELVMVESWQVDEVLKSGAALAALSFNKFPPHGFKSILLGALEFRAVASPTFMEKNFAKGVSAESIKRATSLRHSSRDDLQQEWARRAVGTALTSRNHTIPSSFGCVAACRRDMAWGVIPSLMVDELIGSGELVELVEGVTLRKDVFWQYSMVIASFLSNFTRSVQRSARIHLDQSMLHFVPYVLTTPHAPMIHDYRPVSAKNIVR
jgi:LysR family transcriptional regulator, chromosome initiation inhibitor